ncbi:DUF3267 domain-containing protein [Halobacillus sp. A5]|uniref:DUF3267 domain-containing protein n=1 Tax=Halobacillus sp. A5 TaxID=2880263 RepID=UPI0020A6BA31|nr:DUF3267 domain-containing protein [Halobacillus sp. A5]MCP3026499.1 DUF3267 domain-containing protein [Halobacillus sp. A5]
MKFTTQLPVFNEQLHAKLVNEGWTPFKEPKKLTTAILFSFPFMILNTLIAFAVLYTASLISPGQFPAETFSITINLMGLVYLFLLLIVHELIHLIVVPNFLKSRETFIGVHWLAGFVYTTQVIRKGRFLFISLAPFFLLSIAAPFVLGIFGLLTPAVAILVMINAAASSVDSLTSTIILFQAPGRTKIASNGMMSYWKKDESSKGEAAVR